MAIHDMGSEHKAFARKHGIEAKYRFHVYRGEGFIGAFETEKLIDIALESLGLKAKDVQIFKDTGKEASSNVVSVEAMQRAVSDAEERGEQRVAAAMEQLRANEARMATLEAALARIQGGAQVSTGEVEEGEKE